ncbi:MAG: hypothetical protein AB1758_31650, partial [Candidatus Eremiobacterota bacterium]
MGRRRGVTVIELLVVAMIVGLIVAVGVVRLRQGQSGALSRGLAEVVAEELRMTRADAIARHVPIAVAFPSAGGNRPQAQALYNLEGEVNPRVVRARDYRGEFPQAFVFTGVWPLDGGLAATLAQPRLGTSWDRVDFSAWTNLPDPMLIFLPNGAVRSNGIPRFSQDYHLLVSQGISFAAAAAPSGGPPSLPGYFRPTAVCNPWTISVSPSGAVRVTPGVLAGSSIPRVPSYPITAAAAAPPAVAVTANQPPNPPTITLRPESVAPLPGGVDVILEPDQVLTMRVEATDPDGDPLFCSWQATAGAFSSPLGDRMEWDPAAGVWVSTWEWTPAGAAGNSFQLTCRVEDRHGAATSSVTATRTVSMGSGEQVLFSAEIDGLGSEMWVCSVSLDGTSFVRITDTVDFPERCYLPRVSPDQSRIAYIAEDYPVAGLARITVMNVDGTDRRVLTTYDPNMKAKRYYSWSPDSTMLAYSRQNGALGSDMFSVQTDGTGETPLPGNSALSELEPAWSPDGRYLAFTRLGAGDERLCVHDYQTAVTSEIAINAENGANGIGSIAWAPDSSRIAYVRFAYGAVPSVYVIQPDGSGDTLVRNDAGGAILAKEAAWSSDSKRLSMPDVSGGIANLNQVVVDATPAGLGTVLFSTPGICDPSPGWSQDG